MRAHASAWRAGSSRHAPRSFGPPLSVRPCGTARSIAARIAPRSSGRSSARRLVRTAIMPHPRSTPTAAGMIAPRVGMTLPTVADRLRKYLARFGLSWAEVAGRGVAEVASGR